MSLHVLEDAMCRINVLKPGQSGLWDECATLGALICKRPPAFPRPSRRQVRRTLIDPKYLIEAEFDRSDRVSAAGLIAGLILLEVVVADRIGRAPSFTNIVRQLYAGYKSRRDDATHLLRLVDDAAYSPGPHTDNIRHLVRMFLSHRRAGAAFKATEAMDLLIRSARYEETRRVR